MSVGILIGWLTTPFLRDLSYEIIEAALIDRLQLAANLPTHHAPVHFGRDRDRGHFQRDFRLE